MSEPNEPAHRQMEVPLPGLARSPLGLPTWRLSVGGGGGGRSGRVQDLGGQCKALTLLRPFQIWQGIDIETKMHVRFLNMETIALCH